MTELREVGRGAPSALACGDGNLVVDEEDEVVGAVLRAPDAEGNKNCEDLEGRDLGLARQEVWKMSVEADREPLRRTVRRDEDPPKDAEVLAGGIGVEESSRRRSRKTAHGWGRRRGKGEEPVHRVHEEVPGDVDACRSLMEKAKAGAREGAPDRRATEGESSRDLCEGGGRHVAVMEKAA